MTKSQPPENPLMGVHINTVLQVILDRLLTALHQEGFTDIRPAHLSIFRNLVPQACCISELADRAGITKASVIYLVEYLQQRGYVERVPDASDGRVTLVQFDERGWLAYHVARTAVLQLQEEWAQLVGEDEMEAFLATLAHLASLLSEHAAQGPKPRPARLRGRRHAGL